VGLVVGKCLWAMLFPRRTFLWNVTNSPALHIHLSSRDLSIDSPEKSTRNSKDNFKNMEPQRICFRGKMCVAVR